jgi:hypothetical protein
MIRLILTWSCLGAVWPPEPCDATGTTNASAQRHTDDAKHCTVTSQRPEGET